MHIMKSVKEFLYFFMSAANGCEVKRVTTVIQSFYYLHR